MSNTLDNLTDEELDLLIKEKQASTTESVPSSLDEVSDDQLDLMIQQKAEEQSNALDSAVSGLAQGATLGFSDELEGLAKTGLRKLQGDDREWTEIYEDERDLARKDIEMARLANPKTFIASEIVAGGVSTALTGGSAAGIRGAMSLGGIAGAGFSNRSGSELAKDVALGAALGAGGELAFKGIGKVWNKVKNRSTVPTIEAMEQLGESSLPEAVRLEESALSKAYQIGKDGNYDNALSSQEFLESAAKNLDSAVDNMPKRFRQAQNLIEQEMDTALSKVPVTTQSVMDDIKFAREASKLLNESDKSAWRRFDDSVLKPLESGKFVISGRAVDPQSLNPREMRGLKQEIFNMVRRESNDAPISIFKDSRNVASISDDFSNTLIEKFNSLSPEIASANKKYINTYKALDNIPTSRSEFLSLADTASTTARATQNLNLIEAINDMGPEFADQFKKDYNPLIDIYNASWGSRQFNLNISTMFQAKAAGAATEQAGLGQTGLLFALGQGGMLRGAELSGKLVSAFKFPRNSADMIKNADLAVRKMMNIDRGLAVALNDAIVSRDVGSINSIMASAISANPAVAAEMQEGLGYEGRITSPEEIQIVKQQISSSKLSTRQKMRASQQLNSGLIPTPETPENPFLKQYTPRKRDEDGRKI